jgi:hypothetical protein
MKCVLDSDISLKRVLIAAVSDKGMAASSRASRNRFGPRAAAGWHPSRDQ